MENTRPQVKMVKFASLGLIKSYDETYAKLTWSIRMGYPRITVYLDNKNFSDKMDYSKIITAPMTLVTLETFYTFLGKVIDGDNGVSYAIDCMNIKWENGVKTDKSYLQATVTVGKSDDGIVYIAVTEEGKVKVKFDITLDTRWYRLKDSSGATITDPVILSKIQAKSYLKTLTKVIDSYTSDQGKVEMLAPPGSNNKSYGNKSTYKAPQAAPVNNTVDSSPGVDKELDDMFKD